MTVPGKGGTPTAEQRAAKAEERRRAERERLMREIADADLEVLAEALALIRSKEAAPGIKIQAMQLIRGAVPGVAETAPEGVPPFPESAPRESFLPLLRRLAESVPFADVLTLADAARGSFGVADPDVARSHLARSRAEALKRETERVEAAYAEAMAALAKVEMVGRFERFVTHEASELRALRDSPEAMRMRVEDAATSGVVGDLIAPALPERTAREVAEERRRLLEDDTPPVDPFARRLRGPW